MNAQEIFDTVASHLLQQGRKAVSVLGSCRYRITAPADVVLKCAIGCLIPDELYNPEMEGPGVSNLAVAKDYTWLAPVDVALLLGGRVAPHASRNMLAAALNRAGISGRHRTLLTGLQAIHDDFKAASWKTELHALAGNLGLEWKFAGVDLAEAT